MKTVIGFIVIAGAAAYGLLSYHFIIFDNSFEVIKKTEPRLEDTFVDGRGVKKLELLAKPDLVEAGIQDILNQAGAAIEGAEQN